MSLYDNFIEWLDSIELAKSTKDQYRKGILKVDEISKKNDLESVFNWSIDDWETKQKELLLTPEMFADSKKAIPPGGGSFSASLSQFKKFIQTKKEEFSNQEYIVTTPKSNYSNYKWNWATSTPQEGLNKPSTILSVLKCIDKVLKEGSNTIYTQQFKDKLKTLEVELELSNESLTKERNNVKRNIIASNKGYWSGIGLIDSNNNLTELGLEYSSGRIEKSEFATRVINELILPNSNLNPPYNEETIREWNKYGLEIHPLKLLIQILNLLQEKYNLKTQPYITFWEYVDIILPIAADTPNDLNKYCIAIIAFRNSELNIDTWPKYYPITAEGNKPTEIRHYYEYLLFLTNYGFIDVIKTGKTKYDANFYLTPLARKIFSTSEVIKNEQKTINTHITQNDFKIKQFKSATKDSGLNFSEELITRYIASLATKPFVLLSGLSGSGKTKLAEAFAKWICKSEDQYALIPVGADWTNREPLLGYPNALKDNEYVKPDNDALDLLLRAKENKNKPYFLILDEMNLSHVERYFADFLSTMESKNSIPLHKMESEIKEIPKRIKLPKNLFIVGTVNIDETTYMFSPKVLDRANTIEFRVSDTDISGFLKNPNDIELEKLKSKGANMALNFVAIAKGVKEKEAATPYKLDESQQTTINEFFIELQKSGAEFGYRTAFEISKLIYKLKELGLTDENDKLDIAIMQKMLPKLHGSRTKLTRTLKPLAKLCLDKVDDEFDKKYLNNFENINFKGDKNIKYKLSFEKIMRMYKNAVENGFASYAEA